MESDRDTTITITVSIPFKREGTWKAGIVAGVVLYHRVSIPFKREGTWKGCSGRSLLVAP